MESFVQKNWFFLRFITVQYYREEEMCFWKQVTVRTVQKGCSLNLKDEPKCLHFCTDFLYTNISLPEKCKNVTFRGVLQPLKWHLYALKSNLLRLNKVQSCPFKGTVANDNHFVFEKERERVLLTTFFYIYIQYKFLINFRSFIFDTFEIYYIDFVLPLFQILWF